MTTRGSLALVTVAALVAAAGSVIAQNGTLPAVPAKSAPEPAATPEGTSVTPKDTGGWQTTGSGESPTRNHEFLRALAGAWQGQVELFAEPGAAPVTSTITVANSFSFGRYLTTSFATKIADQPFQGVQTMGFNSTKNQFESTWIDNLSTAIAFNTGQCDPSGTTFTLSGRFEDPASGEWRTQKTVTKVNGDQYSIECFDVDSSGKENVLMRITLHKVSAPAASAPRVSFGQTFKSDFLAKGALVANKPMSVDKPMLPGTAQNASAAPVAAPAASVPAATASTEEDEIDVKITASASGSDRTREGKKKDAKSQADAERPRNSPEN